MKIWIILSAGLMAAPALATDQQFDLVCASEARLSPIGHWRRQDVRYRVDLASERWCEGTCNGTEHIESVTDTRLLLIDQEKQNSTGVDQTLWIDRTSGDLHYLFTGGSGTFMERRGTCSAEKFSGFPDPVRKF